MSIIKLIIDTSFFACAGLAVAGGWQAYRRLTNWSGPDRLVVALIPIGAVFFVAIGLREILQGPFHMWESVRLLPSYIIARGLPHFYPLERGPVLDMMYGPGTAFAYYPVTLFAQRATTATMLAKLLTYTYYFGPVVWLFLRPEKTRPRLAFTILCLLAFALYSHETDILAGSGYANHSDAPALGLGAIACTLLLKRRAADDRLFLLLSACCAVLSVWTKQVMLPIIVALPIYLLIREGAQAAGRYVGYLFICGTSAAVLFGHKFGFSRLWDNLVINPCRQPWEGTWVKVQGRAIGELLDECRWLMLLSILFGMYAIRTSKNPLRVVWRQFLGREWALFFIVGICMIPTALIGRVKAGGGLNALSFCVYFMVIAIGLLLREISEGTERSPTHLIAQHLAKVGVLFGVASSILIHTLTISYFYLHLAGNINALDTNPLRMGYNFMKRHPEEVYLPWNSLTSFLADGRLYHFDYALLDREIGGAPVTMEHFRQNIPSKLRWVAFPPAAQDQFVMKFLPDFSRQITLRELPGWSVYIRPDGGAAALGSATTIRSLPDSRRVEDL